MTPTELRDEAKIIANIVGEDRVDDAIALARAIRLYKTARRRIARRFKGQFYVTIEAFTLTSTNTFTPATPMLKALRVERAAGANQWLPIDPVDRGRPDAYLGWEPRAGTIVFSQTGQAAGDYRLTYFAEHAIGAGDQMDLPEGYEDVLTHKMAAWYRRPYEEEARELEAVAKDMEDEIFHDLQDEFGWGDAPGMTYA